MEKETIGTYRGKEITKMSRDELLDFAGWASREMQDLNRRLEPFHETILEKEVSASLNPKV